MNNYAYKKRNASGHRNMLPLNSSINAGYTGNQQNSTPSKMTSSKAGIIQNGLNSLQGINSLNVGSNINNSKTPKEQFKRMQQANSGNGNHSNRANMPIG